jgi:hypothetical protein
VASLEMQAAQIEMQIAEGSREGAPGTPQAEPPDPILAGTRAVALGEVQAAERALLDKQARFTDEHPDVKLARWHLSQVQAKLKAADAALAAHRPATKAAAAAPAGGGENSPAAARAAALKRALAAVRSQLAAVKTRGARTPAVRLGTATVAVDTEWSQLARAVMEARDRQEQMEARQFQAQLLATLVADRQAGGLIIADPPFRPVRPVSGGRFKIALVGGAAAVVLAALAMLITALLDRRLYDRRDVERIVGSDVIVVVTRLALKPIAKPAAKLAAKPARTGA